MTGKLIGDRPIRVSQDDVFGLSSFATALATSLLTMSPADGLVISVEAPWGTGKSSAIALALRTVQIRELSRIGESVEELEKLSPDDLEDLWDIKAKKRSTHVMRFNPWNFSGQENLVRAFFRELEAQIGIKAEGKVAKAMGRVADFLPSALGGLAGAGALTTGNVSAAGAAAVTGRAAGESAQKILGRDISLERAKRNLAKELKKAGQRIIVIIDDIDRLVPSDMRSIFSLAKSLGDLPNVLYVLAFDEAVVKKALLQGSEKLDPDFLDKVIQVSLKLPPPWREEMRGFFFSRLNAVIGDAEVADQERWRNMFLNAIDPYLETPRDVIRLANTLQVIWPNVAGDVDLIDLLALLTIQLFESSVYEKLNEEIEIITRVEHRFEDDTEFGKRFEPNNAQKPDVAKQALAIMFPRLARAWNTYDFDSTHNIIMRNQRRICTAEYCRNYFLFGRDRRRLSKAEIDNLLASSDPETTLRKFIDRLASLETNSRHPAIATMLEQLTERVASTPALTPAFVSGLLDVSDELIRREDLTWELFTRSNIERLPDLIRLGLGKLDKSERTSVFGALLNHESGLQLRSIVVEFCARQHGLFLGKTVHESERLFQREEIEPAAVAIRDQIKSAMLDGSIWDMPKPIQLIWRLRRMSDKAELEPWFNDLLSQDDLVVKMANELPRRSYQTSAKGQEVVWIFRRSDFSDCFDVDQLIIRLEKLAESMPAAAEALNRLTMAEKEASEL